MLKKGLFRKVFVLMTLLSLAIGIVIIAVATRERTQDLERALIQESKLLAETISAITETAYLEGILPFTTLKKIADAESTSFLWIVKPDGEIYYTGDPKMFGKIIDDPSLGTEEMVIRDSISPEDGQRIKLIVSPLRIEAGEKPWSLYWGIFLKPIIEAQKRMIFTGLIFLSGVIATFVFISFYLAKGITKPLEDLRKGTEIIGKGDLDYRIKVKTGDEIEELGEGFNQMAEELKKSHTTLEEAKTVLEIKVQARTKELKELAQRQEEVIKERTKEIQERVEELEKFQKLAVGRELKMIELKKDIKKLKEELKKYKLNSSKVENNIR